MNLLKALAKYYMNVIFRAVRYACQWFDFYGLFKFLFKWNKLNTKYLSHQNSTKIEAFVQKYVDVPALKIK